jgi:hypothetical protein
MNGKLWGRRLLTRGSTRCGLLGLTLNPPSGIPVLGALHQRRAPRKLSRPPLKCWRTAECHMTLAGGGRGERRAPAVALSAGRRRPVTPGDRAGSLPSHRPNTCGGRATGVRSRHPAAPPARSAPGGRPSSATGAWPGLDRRLLPCTARPRGGADDGGLCDRAASAGDITWTPRLWASSRALAIGAEVTL